MIAILSPAATAQVSSIQSLKGSYYFRQVAIQTDSSANFVDTRTASGTLLFDGNGGFTLAGQQLVGTAAPTALSGPGTYAIKPGGFTTLSNPLLSGVTVNARLGTGALIGSSTEAGATVFDLFIAIPAVTKAISDQTLSGTYWISSLEFPSGGSANIRDTNFKLTSNGAGSFTETTITGQANNLGNTLLNQTVGPITYSVAPDGTGSLTFPAASGLNSTTQLIEGTKNIYVSQDGTYFVGGSTAAGGHGIVIGVKGSSGNAGWNGKFFAAGMRYDTASQGAGARLAAVVGSVNATSLGSVWSRRTRQSDGVFDASLLIGYSLNPDGSGTFTSTQGHVDVASGGQIFSTSGVDVASSPSYEIYFGAMMPPQSGTGVFLNPQGVYNAASFAPAGAPVSPGGFVTIFGTGFPAQSAKALAFPFPTLLGGVQVKVNGTPAPVYSVTPSQISIVVPYEVSGSTATIIATVNETKSNTVEVPLSPTAPGIFSLTSNGLGDGAILHADYSVVSQTNPAAPGEIVQVFLTGLGAVNPSVMDGAAAPTKPLAQVTGPVNVYVGGLPVTSIQYKGLTPGLASLYQLNVQIPMNISPGAQTLAVQTPDGFTDMVNLWIALPE